MGMHKGMLGQSEGAASADLTLGDYIARKSRNDAFANVKQEKKLSCDEWITKTYGGINALPSEIKNFIRAAWKAAQENK